MSTIPMSCNVWLEYQLPHGAADEVDATHAMSATAMRR